MPLHYFPLSRKINNSELSKNGIQISPFCHRHKLEKAVFNLEEIDENIDKLKKAVEQYNESVR